MTCLTHPFWGYSFLPAQESWTCFFATSPQVDLQFPRSRLCPLASLQASFLVLWNERQGIEYSKGNYSEIDYGLQNVSKDHCFTLPDYIFVASLNIELCYRKSINSQELIQSVEFEFIIQCDLFFSTVTVVANYYIWSCEHGMTNSHFSDSDLEKGTMRHSKTSHAGSIGLPVCS